MPSLQIRAKLTALIGMQNKHVPKNNTSTPFSKLPALKSTAEKISITIGLSVYPEHTPLAIAIINKINTMLKKSNILITSFS